ncbi:hypothetical protein JXQ31_10240, partial [candidate division KSB1 bacterium]|nr:hypothetical protein [candidate division KSB1 bacterium]
MKKQILLVVLFFVFSVLSTTATGQQGNALLKIVKSEDGSVKVYDMQGNEIHQSKANAKEKGEANKTMDPGASQSQELHQVILDPAEPEAQ